VATALTDDAPPFLAYRQGGLEMDGVALAALVARHGTPFFVLSERRLVANYHALREGLGAAGVEVTLRYCAKANNEAGVLAALAREGSSLLASHAAEVELGLACGFPPSRIAYQRPAPPPAEAAAVLAAGVGLVHVFRPQDVDLFATLAARGGHRLRLSLRLRDERRASLSPLAALNRRLGLSSAEARGVALACRDNDRLKVAALNVYVGTQQPGLTAFGRALRRACELARALGAEQAAAVEEVNLGGGIPSPSLRKVGPRQLWARWRDRPLAATGSRGRESAETPALTAEFARRLAARYREAAAAAGLERPPGLAAEPGRSIVGNAGVLVAAVASAEDGWLFLDASRNFLGESPLLFSRRLLPLRQASGGGERFVHLAGSTLNTTDVLDLHRRLPPLSPGDGLAFCDAGAYSISRANRYAGMAPAVLLLGRDGVARAIRRPEGLDDLAGPMAPALAAAPAEAG
jgi:diaminopimelate decarboxylase